MSRKTTPKNDCKAVVPHVKGSTGGKPIPQDQRDAIINHILHEIATTKNGIQKICQDDGRIAAFTFRTWLDEDESLVARYVRAQDERAEMMGAELLAIADDGSNDTYIDEEGHTRVDHDNIQRSKLRVDTRKWLMAHLAPKRWGDRPPREDGLEVVVPIQINIG